MAACAQERSRAPYRRGRAMWHLQAPCRETLAGIALQVSLMFTLEVRCRRVAAIRKGAEHWR